MADNSNPAKQSWFRRHGRLTKTAIALLVLVALLVALRIALPEIVQRYVNRKLDESPDYAGQVGDIDMVLLAGSYSIEGIEITKTSGDVPVPLFAARAAKFSLLWNALVDGAVVGEVELFEPIINIVDGEAEESQQTGAGGPWLSIVDDLFPLRIDKVLVHDGQLHFQNFESDPPVDIYLSQVQAEVLNLTNSKDLADTMVSRVKLDAVAMEQGVLSANMAFDPTLENPTFDLNARLLNLPIITLDQFISAYAPFDIEAGILDVVTEMVAVDGNLDGYVKPLIHDLKIFEWQADVQEDNDNPLRVLWEGAVGLLSELLENQQRNQFATRIPITGEFEQPDAGVVTAVVNVLKNAFIEALRADLDDTFSLGFGDDDSEDEVSWSTDYESELDEESAEDADAEPVEVESPVNN